jgi:alkanesulfonate monooxygenase SsuD/methylene tetrahydromethanopterin reductase-like flavin-dependent oxidoreductase (luciferase family)
LDRTDRLSPSADPVRLGDMTEFAIALPQHLDGGALDAVAFREYLTRAEHLGFDSAWAGEMVLGAAPHLGAIETMTYAAACTERIRLGCAAFVTPMHSPVHLAKSLSTLDQLSGGRVEVCVATGERFRPFQAFGIDGSGFVSRLTEGLAVMKALWTQERVNLDTRFWRLENAAMEPKPVQRPGPPIWIAGSHPNALRRAMRLGDGLFGSGTDTTEQFASQVRIVRDELGAGGDFRIAKRVYVAVDDDAARARKQVAERLDERYGFFGFGDLSAVAVAGTVGDCVRGLRAVVDAGADLILIDPIAIDAELLERLGTEVVPLLRKELL